MYTRRGPPAEPGNRINQPGSPQVELGHDEIAAWLRDMCGREMSHEVQHSVADAGGAAFSEACC